MKELQQIAINHSTDIDYKDFMKIYIKCTNKLYSFLTTDTTLLVDNHLGFRKFFFRFIIKMTLTHELKILDDKIKANQGQQDLDREAAKISALSSGEIEKYEYLTGEDLGYKPGLVEKAKFEYSLLGKVFNKGLDEKYKKVGLLKRFKNIEGKNEERLRMIENKENKHLGIKSVISIFDDELSQEAKNFLYTLSNQEKRIG